MLRKKELKEKLSKHVNDIATKYIIPGETAASAILFLPSVALFLEIVEEHSDILLAAHRRNVWLACPTTLAAVLTTLQGVSRGMALQDNTEQVYSAVQKLSKDVDLLVQRFELAERSVDKCRAELAKMQVSVHKIRKVKMELDVLSGGLQLESSASSPSASAAAAAKKQPPPRVASTDQSTTTSDNDENASSSSNSSQTQQQQRVANAAPAASLLVGDILDKGAAPAAAAAAVEMRAAVVNGATAAQNTAPALFADNAKQ